MSYLTKQVITNADGTTVETEPQEVAEDGGYITYDSDTATLTLGKNGDPSKVAIDNDSMDVVVGSTTVATFGETTEIGYTVIPDDDSYETHTSTINLGTFFKNSTQEKNTSLSITGTVYKDGDFVYDGASFATLKGESIDIVGSYGSMSIGAGKQSGGISGAIHPLEFNWNSEFGSPRFNNGGLPIESGGTGATSVTAAQKTIGLAAYPVGAVYISYVSTSPASLFGGTWTAITGRFPYFNAGTATGGSNTHTLTVNEMPAHSHSTSNWVVYDKGNGNVWDGNSVITSYRPSTYFGNGVVGTNSVGGSAAHNNMPAYQTFYAWRRTA